MRARADEPLLSAISHHVQELKIRWCLFVDDLGPQYGGFTGEAVRTLLRTLHWPRLRSLVVIESDADVVVSIMRGAPGLEKVVCDQLHGRQLDAGAWTDPPEPVRHLSIASLAELQVMRPLERLDWRHGGDGSAVGLSESREASTLLEDLPRGLCVLRFRVASFNSLVTLCGLFYVALRCDYWLSPPLVLAIVWAGHQPWPPIAGQSSCSTKLATLETSTWSFIRHHDCRKCVAWPRDCSHASGSELCGWQTRRGWRRASGVDGRLGATALSARSDAHEPARPRPRVRRPSPYSSDISG